MTIAATVGQFAELAKTKSEHIRRDPVGFAFSSMMAGVYVGFGILLIFSVGQSVDPSVRSLAMGFGIALTLVVFAGSDLFTGHTMYFAFGRLTGACGTADVVRSWTATWIFNLVGSIGLAALFVAGGGGEVLQSGEQGLIHAVAYKKMSPQQLSSSRGACCAIGWSAWRCGLQHEQIMTRPSASLSFGVFLHSLPPASNTALPT